MGFLEQLALAMDSVSRISVIFELGRNLYECALGVVFLLLLDSVCTLLVHPNLGTMASSSRQTVNPNKVFLGQLYRCLPKDRLLAKMDEL